MASRRTSLSDTADLAISREIDSKYDDVKNVSDHMTDIVACVNNISNVTNILEHIPVITNVGGSIGSINTVANIQNSITALASDVPNINKVALDLTNIDTVARDLANIDLVAKAVDSIDAVITEVNNINTVKNSLQSITTAANDIAKIGHVSDRIDKVNTVANSIDNVNVVGTDIINVDKVAHNVYDIRAVSRHMDTITSIMTNIIPNVNELLDVNNKADHVDTVKNYLDNLYVTFDTRYMGAKSSDPIVDNYGNPLIDGALYLNTSIDHLRVYDKSGTRWITLPQAFLSEMMDVVLVSRAIGDILYWDGSNWVNIPISDLNVKTATKLINPRTIAATGDATWSTVFDGASNVSSNITLANTGVIPGSYKQVTIDSKGRVLTGYNPSTVAEFGLTDVFTKTEVNTNITTAVNNLVNGAPEALNTLQELAAALGDDANFSTTLVNNLATKVSKNNDIIGATNSMITYDNKGLVTGGITPTTLAGYSIADAYTKTEGDARYESKNVNIQNHIASTSNPHGVTKTQVGLGNVDNTADINKSVLSATKLTTARSINGVSFDGTSNISINTNNPQVIKFDTGVIEGEDLYTFNGSSTKTIDIKAGTNITLTKTAGVITINANDTSVNLSEVQGLGTGVSTFLATPNSANLAAALTDETGSGSLVFATSPTLVTPNIGVATGTSFNSITGLSSTTPLVAGTATIGTSTAVARADHIHPVQTSVTGNAGTATKLETARTIAGVSFDGSANIAIPFANLSTTPTTVAGYGITDVYTKTQTDSNISTAVAGLVNGSPAALDTLNELAAALGNDANFATTVSTSIGTKVTKNADIVGGTNTKITYDAKGLVTGGTSLAATDIPALDWSKITTGKPTTLSGYGISDATPSSHIGTTGASHGVATTSVNGFMSSADKTKLDGIATNANNYVHPTSGVVAGTYTKITVDSNGHATAGSTPTTLAGYSIGDAYTKTESDSALALKTNKADTDSVNMLRADKFLAAQNIVNMIYTNGDLTKIQYNNATDVNYEVLNYVSGNLSTINHYTGGVLRGTTTLSYSSGNLVSAVFA